MRPFEWTSLPNDVVEARDDDRPRFLTDGEVEYVLDHLPAVRSCDSTAAEVARRGIISTLRTQLRNTMWCPSVIPELVRALIRQHNSSLIATGTAVGLAATEALGGPTTQLTLNSFRATGPDSLDTGIEAIKDIIYAKSKRKIESCLVFFTDRNLTYQQALDYRIDLVGTSVKYFVRDYMIFPVAELPRDEWYSSSLAALSPLEIPQATRVLRLYLDRDRLYRHRVSILRLVRAILTATPDAEEDETIPLSQGPVAAIVIVPSPLEYGIIDIYPTAEINIGVVPPLLSPELRETTFLQDVMLVELDNINVKGIRGIESINPVVTEVLDIIHTERLIHPQDYSYLSLPVKHEDRTWVCFLDQQAMLLSGIEVSNVERLINATQSEESGGCKIQERIEDSILIVILPEHEARSPKKYLRDLIRRDRDSAIEQNQRFGIEHQSFIQSLPAGDLRRYNTPRQRAPRSVLVDASEYLTLETIGTNLTQLLGYPGIDSNRTISNNPHIVANTLGLEAALALYIQEINKVIKTSDSYIHPANIRLIAEIAMSRGLPTGASYPGIAKQRVGYLSLATIERAMQALTTAAAMGKNESSRGVSASVALGTLVPLGTGAIDVAMTYQGKILMNDQVLDPLGTTIQINPTLEIPNVLPAATVDTALGDNNSHQQANFQDGDPVLSLASRRARPTAMPASLVNTLSRLPTRLPTTGPPIIRTGLRSTVGIVSSLPPIIPAVAVANQLLDSLNSTTTISSGAPEVAQALVPVVPLDPSWFDAL